MYHNADDLDLVEIVAAMRARMRQSQRRIVRDVDGALAQLEGAPDTR